MSRWKRSVGEEYIDFADDLTGYPPQSTWAKWVGGVVLPLLPLWVAINCWVTQKGFFPGFSGRRFGHGFSRYDLTGTQAIILGFLLLGIAAFIHFHYFWGNSRKLWTFMEFGKIISGLLAVGCILYLYWFMWYDMFGNVI
jgi:hypothetical protein